MKLMFILPVLVMFSNISHAKSVKSYYKHHQSKRCEALERYLIHVEKLISFSEDKEYKERKKEKKALKKLKKEKKC